MGTSERATHKGEDFSFVSLDGTAIEPDDDEKPLPPMGKRRSRFELR